MTQEIFAVKLTPMKAKILVGRVPVKKVDVRSMQVTGGKVYIPNGFSLGTKLLTTTMTATTIADMKERTHMSHTVLVCISSIAKVVIHSTHKYM